MLAKREERAGEGDQPLQRLLLEWEFSLLDERLRRRSEREDFLDCSLQPAEPVAEAAPAGEPPPGAGTLTDEHAEGAATGTGAAEPGNNPAPEPAAAENTAPATTSTVHGTPTD